MSQPEIATPAPEPEDELKAAIAELRALISAPFVRVRASGGADVHCWAVSAGFRCPTCDTENIVGLQRTVSGVDEVTCGECGRLFEVEFR